MSLARSENTFVANVFPKATPEVLLPVMVIAESKDKAVSMLREHLESDVEILSVTGADDLKGALALLDSVAKGETQPAIMQQGFEFNPRGIINE